MRLAPPTRGVDAYFADKRDVKEFNDPVKPTGPTRRTFAEKVYREERAKTKTRERVPSEEREAAREIRRLERELKEKETARAQRRSLSPEVTPAHLRPPSARATDERSSSSNADKPTHRRSKAPPATLSTPAPASGEPPKSAKAEPPAAPKETSPKKEKKPTGPSDEKKTSEVEPPKETTPAAAPKPVSPPQDETPAKTSETRPSSVPQSKPPLMSPAEYFKGKGKGGIILGRPAKKKWE